ncbi:hypothetical protein DV096_20250 [Bradymonadaceae bacterium TMQ3]|uniref:Outer membrane protein beta-barrel domain-containing protein n=1 Tax=Lujinxingia sediminis TaxID=2480984 RepID=A0ABY0CNQ8_9DELT|nr:outer membrane beta-barrel protein [Lujinxingia sediminis]RDV36253.1 hypothetical protein DV096_20250 [Bradymonadaceae bacterium TMQ3]RVU40998.1 hypothetical protein EA187_19665 [Lujinxingia sediminis]TXC67697.1 hypothetical protein FRC91_19920 [Bradymonadales bacterium TMQ1]
MKMAEQAKTTTRSMAVVLAGCALMMASAGVASAQEPAQKIQGNSVGVMAGYDFDREFPLLGIDGRFTFAVAPQVAISVNPALSYFFTGSSELFGARARTTLLQFDVNALAHLALDAVVTPYLGGGLAVIYVDSRVLDSNDNVITSSDDTFTAANLLVGATFDTGSELVPYLQGRMTFDEESVFSLMVGLNYGF